MGISRFLRVCMLRTRNVLLAYVLWDFITGRICRRQLCRYFVYYHGPILGFFAP